LNDETFTDFEDGLQYFTAIEHEQDMILPGTLKDYNPHKYRYDSPTIS